jgi:pyruvate kinase
MSKKQDAAIAKIKGERGMSVRIANALKIKKAAVYQWQKVPPARVQIVSEIIDMPPEKIRPDIFRKN